MREWYGMQVLAERRSLKEPRRGRERERTVGLSWILGEKEELKKMMLEHATLETIQSPKLEP